MASYYKKYYRNKYKRYYKNYYGGSSSKKKAYGNMKAAKQQADQSTFTINIPTNISCFSQWNNDKSRCYGVYPMNIYDYLRRSEFYNSYASMYDEFKIDRIKVKLLPTSWTISTETAYKNVTVYTAWDRTGISANQLYLVADSLKKGDDYLGASDNTDGVRCVIGEDITTYSSSESRTINPNTNTSITRWLNPKTMAEKSQWINTSQLRKWYNDYDKNHSRFYGIPVSDAALTELGEIEQFDDPMTSTSVNSTTLFNLSPMTKDNPCYLEEDNAIKFKPTLLVGTYPPVESSEDTPNIVNFNVEIECVCTFRGLRKAKIVA